MKKIFAIILCMAICLTTINVFAVTIVLDGEVVTEDAYIKDGATFADAADIEALAEGEIAVRKYYEEQGKVVAWNGEEQTVNVSTSLFDNYYRIVNKATGNVIVAQGYNKENLALIVTEKKNTTNREQIFRYAKIDEEYGHFTNMLSTRALDVPDARVEENVQLIQYSYVGNNQQKMKLTNVGGGYYTIKPAHCDLVLTEKDGKVVQTSETDSDYSMWKLEYVSGSILSTLKQSPGYMSLDERLQRAADEYFTDKIWITQQAKAHAESVFAAADYNKLSEVEQANLIKEALHFTASQQVGGVIASDYIAEYKIVKKTYHDSYDIWRGEMVPCWLYDVEMAGDSEGQIHKFTLVSNQEDVPMVERSIEALGRTPYAIRQYVKTLYWKAGDGANSYNGGNDAIWIRLVNEVPDSKTITGVLCHELGHVLNFNTLSDYNVWSYAESLDAIPISGYGSSNQYEDLAEFSKLYFMCRDTESFEHLDEIYPNRFKIFSGMLYRADKQYYAHLQPYEKYIIQAEEALGKKTDDSIVKELDDTYYYVIRDKESGKVWTVTDSNAESDVPVILTEYEEGNTAQMFRFEKNADTVRFYSKHSGSSLQIDDSAMPNKTINQYGGYWAIDDQFAVYKAEGGYQFESARYSLSIGTMRDTLVAGIGGKGNVFELIEAEKNMSNLNYTIKINGTNSYLDAVDSENYKVVSVTDNAVNWKVKEFSEGVCTLVHVTSGEAMDILDFSLEEGQKVILWSSTGGDNQKFIKEEAEGGVRFKGVQSGLYVTVNDDGTVTQEAKSNAKKQVFTVLAAE